MRSQIARIAVAQVILVVYCVLGMAVILKVTQGSPAPDIFAKYVRDWGSLFLLLSVAWCAWAVYEMGKPESDHRTGIGVLLSGVGLVAVIAVVGFMGTMSAMLHHLPLPVRATGEIKPSISQRPFPSDP